MVINISDQETQPLHVFYTIWGYLVYFFIALIIMIVSIFLLIIPFNKEKKLTIYSIKFFCKIFFFLNFKQKNFLNFNNISKPKAGEKRIYIINHTSIFDSIMIYSLPGNIKTIMKKSYLKIPFTGLISLLAGNVIMKRKKSISKDIYNKVIKKLEAGSTFVIYPEGTRSKDSNIGKFYNGGFRIIKNTKATVVPVVFDNWNVIRPGSFRIRDLNIHFKILDPIFFKEYNKWTISTFSSIVKSRLISGLIQIRNHRRKNEKNYYRNTLKYTSLDNELLKEIKQ